MDYPIKSGNDEVEKSFISLSVHPVEKRDLSPKFSK